MSRLIGPAVLAVVAFGVVSAVIGSRLPNPAPSSGALGIADQGIINKDLAVVGIDQRAMEEVLSAPGSGELIGSGRAFMVTYGTKVEVMARTSDAFRVRILDGPRIGMDGWVPQNWVKRG